MEVYIRHTIQIGLKVGVLCLVGFIAALTNASAQGIYATGFEQPTYANGNLVGQDGWGAASLLGTASVVVQNTVVRSGSQAVEVTPDTGGTQNLVNHALTYDSATNPNPIVHLNMDAYITSAGTQPYWDIFAIDGNKGFMGQLLVSRNSDAMIGFANTSSGSVPITLNTWNAFEVVLNYNTKIESAYVNGTLIGSGSFASASTTLNDVAFGQNSATGTAKMYVDNLSVAAVPEVGTLFTALLGLTGVAYLRHRHAC